MFENNGKIPTSHHLHKECILIILSLNVIATS